MNSNKQLSNNKFLIDKEIFLEFCHFLYDDLHGKEKIKQIFDIDVQHINNICYLYKSNFILQMYLYDNPRLLARFLV